MKFLLWLQEIGDLRMDKPPAYGWFHLLCIFLSIAIGVILCVTHKKGDERRVRRVVFFTGLLVFILEIFKMYVYHFTVVDGELVFEFQWYVFPWQFCSLPMYVGILAGIFRKGKVHRSLVAFLATYAVFAGLCVMIYPNDALITRIGINIQTMICHGSMLTVGIYLYGSGYVETKHRTILRAIPVFATGAAIAVILNEVVYRSGVLVDPHQFNMFYFSRYYPSTLPIYSAAHEALPFPLNVLLYVVVFTFAAYLMLLGAMGIRRLCERIAGKKKKSEEA